MSLDDENVRDNSNSQKIDELMSKAQQNIFEKAQITIINEKNNHSTIKSYCPTFNWFVSPKIYLKDIKKTHSFTCIICNKSQKTKL